MNEVLHSEVFDHFDKTYLLDRLAGSNSGPVVRITEIVHDGARRGRYSVELDASVVKRIVRFLETPVPAQPPIKTPRRRPFFTGEQRDAMRRHYLKGVTSAALAVQYGCKAADIELALQEEGIEIVDQNPRQWRRYQQKWRRK
ncbi:MAG: hypothetical protein JNL05_10120 [Flavobacteriales bacterium]|nr:hypothetical protein [Flavobacteriales bacterium]